MLKMISYARNEGDFSGSRTIERRTVERWTVGR